MLLVYNLQVFKITSVSNIFQHPLVNLTIHKSLVNFIVLWSFFINQNQFFEIAVPES